MRSESEIRQKLIDLLMYNKEELIKSQEKPQNEWMYRDSISSRSGLINGLCWCLGYTGSLDFIESEVRAGRASLGADIDAKIRAKEAT